MNDMLISIATYNRRDLTGVCLDAVMACKGAKSDVMVSDDGSTEYDIAWLCGFEPRYIASKSPGVMPCGVGGMAYGRIVDALEMGYEYLCLLDNDALVTPRFDRRLLGKYIDMRMYLRKRGHPEDMPMIVTGYRSALHEVEQDITIPDGLYLETMMMKMRDIGGINMVMDRETAQHLLNAIPIEQWGAKWDYRVSEAVPYLYAPAASLIEHMGRHGGGVNGASADRAIDFIGYR